MRDNCKTIEPRRGLRKTTESLMITPSAFRGQINPSRLLIYRSVPPILTRDVSLAITR